MSDTNSPSYWDAIYQSGRTGWDIGKPNPVFRRILESERFAPGTMLVLCAGRGYDARMFASRGFIVTAVDFSAKAVRDMHSLSDPQIPYEIIKMDLFDIPNSFKEQFDYVLEYTCYCAIDPSRRSEYIKEVARLLKPGGIYIALAFPISSHTGGPPYAVSSDELVDPFLALGFELLQREIPPDSIPTRRGKEELIILRKEAMKE
ncbi:MAG: methyltransferase domain-containing protein [Anaerolineales bacterium]|nr:methyltransferase domain-containing protein [Anaerolineales bacterium]